MSPQPLSTQQCTQNNLPPPLPAKNYSLNKSTPELYTKRPHAKFINLILFTTLLSGKCKIVIQLYQGHTLVNLHRQISSLHRRYHPPPQKYSLI